MFRQRLSVTHYFLVFIRRVHVILFFVLVKVGIRGGYSYCWVEAMCIILVAFALWFLALHTPVDRFVRFTLVVLPIVLVDLSFLVFRKLQDLLRRFRI